MKILAIPDGLMIWDLSSFKDNLYISAFELGELIRWLHENRNEFIENEIGKLKK